MRKTRSFLAWVLLLSMLAVSMLGIFAVPSSASDKTDDVYATINGDASKLSGIKKEYVAGEPINVTAVGSGKDFVGLYRYADYNSVSWYYIEGAENSPGSGVAKNIAEGKDLYPGKYVIYFIPNDGNIPSATAWAEITILPKEGQNYDINAVVQGDSTKLTVEKSVYAVGEPINVSAVGSGKDWVGIYKFREKGSLKYHYVDTAKGGPGSGVAKDVTQGTVLTPGEYVIRLMPNDVSGHGNALAWAIITVVSELPKPEEPDTPIEYAEIKGDATKLTGVKKEYVAGEPVTVTPYGSGENWVGIYRPADYGSSYWLYIDTAKGGAGSGVEVDISKGNELYPGKYIIRVMPKDGPHDTALAWTEITVLPKEGQNYDMTALVQGDSTKLSLEKGTYESGEPIMVTATGSGKDWVGIYKVCVQGSLKYHYIDTAKGGPGSGVAKDVTQGVVLDPGEYVIRVMPNDQSAHGRATAWAVITVTEPAAVVPDAPTSVTYKLNNDTDGFAGGTITVEMPEFSEDDRRDIVMYWANESGKLVGYTALAKFKVTGKTTTHKLASGLMIPNGATKLYVYSMHTKTGTLSEKYVTVELPKDSAYESLGEPLMEFQIVSDIHVTGTAANEYTANYIKMLNDIAANSKKSQGIFVVGDIAHNGYESEYQLAAQLYAEVKGLPKMYYGIGNHDLWNHNNSIIEATELFCKYATLPDGSHPTDSSYDFWLGGYHFIFLGTDFYNSLTASFNMNTINWFESALAENRDPERPIFVMLHQSLYNTVSGSLEGQGWDGVEATSATLLKRVLVKYPEVLMFNGHSHWTLDSESCMYSATEELPINIFNTASVAYLWTSYDVAEGVKLEGSQGYYIRVYEDRVLLLGRDFTTGEWVSSAQFCVEYEQSNDPDTPNTSDNSTNSAKYAAVGSVALVATLTVGTVIVIKKRRRSCEK